VKHDEPIIDHVASGIAVEVGAAKPGFDPVELLLALMLVQRRYRSESRRDRQALADIRHPVRRTRHTQLAEALLEARRVNLASFAPELEPAQCLALLKGRARPLLERHEASVRPGRPRRRTEHVDLPLDVLLLDDMRGTGAGSQRAIAENGVPSVARPRLI
jgi:hypothetical protein